MLVARGFSSGDPDSALYAGIADRLAQEPVRRWIAPEWWGFWPEAQMTGLFREHPAGVFLMSAALTRVGVPAAQGAYVIGIGAGLASLLLMASLIRRVTTRDEARAALVLLQLMPVAFIFRIRANHEYPILVCLLLALLGLAWIGERRPWWMGALAVAAGLAGGLLIKGVFVDPDPSRNRRVARDQPATQRRTAPAFRDGGRRRAGGDGGGGGGVRRALPCSDR